jgi:type IV secretion system protein VirB5
MAVVAVSLVAGGSASAGGWPVFDASSVAQLTMTVKTLYQQLNELQATYRALNGVRGFGGRLYDPALRQYLPPEWTRIYDDTMAGGHAGISGSLRAIRSAERLTSSVADAQASITARSRNAAVTDKAVGIRAFEGARARLAQIEQLMGQIDLTRDPKGIAELQARIAVEQAAVQNETAKLQLVAMLQRAEERLIEQQKGDLAQRILSSSNQGMPACCSSRIGK